MNQRAIERVTLKMIHDAWMVCDIYGVEKGSDRAEVLRIIMESAGLCEEEERVARKVILREIVKAMEIQKARADGQFV